MKTTLNPEPAAVAEVRRLRDVADEAVAHIGDHEEALDAMIRTAAQDATAVEALVEQRRSTGKTLPPFPTTEVPTPNALREIWAIREAMAEKYAKPTTKESE